MYRLDVYTRLGGSALVISGERPNDLTKLRQGDKPFVIRGRMQLGDPWGDRNGEDEEV